MAANPRRPDWIAEHEAIPIDVHGHFERMQRGVEFSLARLHRTNNHVLSEIEKVEVQQSDVACIAQRFDGQQLPVNAQRDNLLVNGDRLKQDLTTLNRDHAILTAKYVLDLKKTKTCMGAHSLNARRIQELGE